MPESAYMRDRETWEQAHDGLDYPGPQDLWEREHPDGPPWPGEDSDRADP